MNSYIFKDNSDTTNSYLGSHVEYLFSEKLKNKLYSNSDDVVIYKGIPCEGLLWSSEDDLVDTKVLWINESKIIECYYNCLLFINSNNPFFKAFKNLYLNKAQDEDIELVKVFAKRISLSSLIKNIIPTEYNNVINYFISHSDDEVKEFILNYSKTNSLKEKIILIYLECLLLKRLGCNYGINLSNDSRFKSSAKDLAEEVAEIQHKARTNDQIRSSSAIEAVKSYVL